MHGKKVKGLWRGLLVSRGHLKDWGDGVCTSPNVWRLGVDLPPQTPNIHDPALIALIKVLRVRCADQA